MVAEDRRIPYDVLIVATGAQHAYFGHDEWEPFAPGLKRIDDATYLRQRILVAFEKAEAVPDPEKRRALLTFVVVGGLVTLLGWRWGYWGPGLIGVVTALGVYMLLKDRPQTLGLPPVNEWKNDKYAEASEDSPRSTVALQFSILKMPAIWVLAQASATT